MTIRSCPQCSTLFIGGATHCDWCAIETIAVALDAPEPIKTRPAIPPEVWAEPQEVDFMEHVRSICGG